MNSIFKKIIEKVEKFIKPVGVYFQKESNEGSRF